MAAFSELHILLSDIQHELNVLIHGHYIKPDYKRIETLNTLRKELLLIVKGGQK